MSKIGIKPESKVVDKGIVRTQKLLDQLQREIDSLKARVTTLETGQTALEARATTLETGQTALEARVTILET